MLEWIWGIVQPMIIWIEERAVGLAVLVVALSFILFMVLCGIVAAGGGW